MRKASNNNSYATHRAFLLPSSGFVVGKINRCQLPQLGCQNQRGCQKRGCQLPQRSDANLASRTPIATPVNYCNHAPTLWDGPYIIVTEIIPFSGFFKQNMMGCHHISTAAVDSSSGGCSSKCGCAICERSYRTDDKLTWIFFWRRRPDSSGVPLIGANILV